MAVVASKDEGPEPIIECNHKKPTRVPTPNPTASPELAAEHQQLLQQQQNQAHGAQGNEMNHNNSGFLGMFQKKMGLGKHSARLSTHAPPMGAGGGAASTNGPVIPTIPHDALPPPHPDDSYQMSDRYVKALEAIRVFLRLTLN